MKHKLLICAFAFSIVLMLFSCKKETVVPEASVAPAQVLSVERIYPELNWIHWHYPNDNDHFFDENHLWIKDSTNSIPNYTNSLLEIWVKRDSTSKWERAIGTVISGGPWPRYTYSLYPDRLVIFIWDPYDVNLFGTKAQVLIRH